MKHWLSPVLLALLLVPWAWGIAAGRQAPGLILKSCCNAVPGARGSFQEDQKVKPGSGFPWILAYRPIRSCHRVLKDKYGEFSPPAYCGNSSMNLWCNWTIWAGSRKHIIIYIQGFITEEGCNKNEDKILFEGVSSLVENSVVYACWKKETHVFATFAQAVHIVLLKRYLPDCRETQFKGKYYMFQDQKDESSFEVDVISETPAPKLPKKDSTFQSRWADEFRDMQGFVTTRNAVSLGKTPVVSGGLLQGGGSTLDTAAVESPVELVTYEGARTLLMETKAPCMPGSELQEDRKYFKEAQGRGIIPAAEQDTWSRSLFTSGDITVWSGYVDRLSSELLETPLLDALQAVETFLQQAGVGVEDRQAILHPTLRPKHLGDLQFTIKPTPTDCLDLTAFSQTLLTDRRESIESRDTTMCRELSPVSLQRDQSHSQPSILADVTVSSETDGLAKGLISSLSSLYEVVNEGHSQLLRETSQVQQISFKDLSMTQPELGTTGLQHTKLLGISSTEHFREVVERKTVLHHAASWDILKERRHLHVQSSPVLHSAPRDPVSLSQNALGHDHPATEEAHVLSLGIKSCHHQSYRAAQPGLIVPTSPTGLEHVSTAKSTLGTETIHVLVLSCTQSVPADFSSTDFASQAHPPPEAKPVLPIVFSPPATLDLDYVNLRQRVGVSLAGPGEQETVSPSPPCHLPAASGPGTDESPGCLRSGMQKLVLEEAGGQQAETSASVGLTARSPSSAYAPSPNLGVGLPWPEGYVSSGAVAARASRPGIWGARREEHVVPLQHQGTVASDEPVSPSVLEEFKMQKTTEALRAGAGQQRNASFSATPAQTHPSVDQGVETMSRDQKPSNDPPSRNIRMPGGQQWKHAELGLPWAMEYFPIRSCHIIFQDGSGIFYLPLHVDVEANIWCNWTIMAGSQKHIVIYVQGFQGNNGCGKNQDKIIFQGVKSSVETKVVYACHNQGILIFATQATAVHVLFLSGSSFLSHEYRYFKGWYYVFKDSEIVGSSNDKIAPQKPVQEVSKKESLRMTVTKSLVPVLRASPDSSGAFAGGRIQPELVSPDNKPQPSPDLMKDAQSGANLSKLDLNECGQPWDVTELERSLKDDSTEDRETQEDMLMELSPTGQGAGHKTELFALEIAEEDVELATVVPCCSAGISSSEVPRSNTHASAKSSSLNQVSDSQSEEVVTAAHCTQTPVLQEPPLNTSTTPSPLYPSPAITAGHVVSPGIRNEEFFDLVSALVSLENDTTLQSQHHPGDVLFEVTIEIKHKDWISRGGCELKKGLESMKNHIQENLKLSANRVNEIKLKEIKRTSDANALLTFWLHLRPEERNMSLLLHSQLEDLLGTSIGVKRPQLVSLFIEDVNECSAGVGLCGEEAECFNSVGTYLCRCKKGYEDHSPTKSGTLCIRVPLSGIGFFLRHADILVGAAITAGLVMLVAAGAMCRASRSKRYPRRSQSPEEPPVRAVEEPVMELHDLGECLRIDPFQLKLRARPPEWLWGVRTHPGQAYQVFLEQSPQL